MNAPLDPLVAQIAAYRAGLAAFEALPDDMTDAEAERHAMATWKPFFLADSYPIPTTAIGAAEALRVALDENDAGEFVTAMIHAALGYLERH